MNVHPSPDPESWKIRLSKADTDYLNQLAREKETTFQALAEEHLFNIRAAIMQNMTLKQYLDEHGSTPLPKNEEKDGPARWPNSPRWNWKE